MPAERTPVRGSEHWFQAPLSSRYMEGGPHGRVVGGDPKSATEFDSVIL